MYCPPTPRPVATDDVEKRAIIAACDAFIRNVLKPRFLPEVRPTPFNYLVDLHGKWAGGRYRFIQRLRSGFPENRGEEFDSAYARIDRMGRDRFDIYWMRHTGAWYRLYEGQTLAEALRILGEDGHLYPSAA